MLIFLLNSKNRKYGWSAAGPLGGRQLGSPQQSEHIDWLVPVCRGPLGPVLLIGADRPARLEMLPPGRPAAGSQGHPFKFRQSDPPVRAAG